MLYKDFTLGSVRTSFNISKLLPETEEYNKFFSEFDTDNIFECSESFKSDLNFSIKAYNKIDFHSESWLRENFISLFLREVWKKHSKLCIWQGIALNVDVDQGLTGEPDYYVTKVSALPNTPYCIIAEAKKDIMEDAWGQCLAAMKGAQVLNKKSEMEIPIYGIISSGLYWQFGKLVDNEFAIYPQEYLSVFKSKQEILNILDLIFTRACQHLENI